MEREGLFRIRAEVTLILMQKFSLSQEEVLSELSVLAGQFVRMQHPAFRFNERRWNVRRYKSDFRGFKLFISVSTHADGYMAVRISIPKYSGDRILEVNNFLTKADEYAKTQLEKILE